MITVTAPVWLWNADKGSWHFLTVPPDQAAEIRFDSIGMRGGFGSVRKSGGNPGTRRKSGDRKSGDTILNSRAPRRSRWMPGQARHDGLGRAVQPPSPRP